MERLPGPNYVADRGLVQVLRGDRPLELLHPEKRSYASGGQVMTDAGIHAGMFADVFVALGEPLGGDAWAVRLQIKPLLRWIWAGAFLMALGGFVTAVDRRFRKVGGRGSDASANTPVEGPGHDPGQAPGLAPARGGEG